MKRHVLLGGTIAAGIVLATWLVANLPVGAVDDGLLPASTRSSVPAARDAKKLLNATHRHREWLPVRISASTSVLAWVVYPERTDRAPVVMLKGTDPRPSDWTRALSDQFAAEGYVTVVPDVLTEVDAGGDRREAGPPIAVDAGVIGAREAAVVAATLELPSATATVAYVEVSGPGGKADIRVAGARASFPLTDGGWPELIAYLNTRTHNRPTFVASEHAEHQFMLQATQAPAPGRGGRGGLAFKDPRLPAGYFTAKSTLASSKLKSEWVDVALEGSTVKLHTFIVYPEGATPAGVVIVMQHGVGLDDWQRALADQVAQDGFMAVAPDLWSGTGPNGGNWDASEFIDDAIRAAAGKITPEETMRRYKAARNYALKLPRANGKSGSIGFCAGGGNSFRFAGDVPEHNAAVVFYGTPPEEETMAKIKAPVLGFYGENDARVTATVEPTKQAMARLGKHYEAHVYPKATHSFVLFQDIGNNPAAIADAWPRTIEFFQRYLN